MSMLLKIWRRHKFEPYRGYIAEHPNDEEEVEGIDLHQQRYSWEGSDMDYLYDEVSISLDGLRSIFESRRFEITKLAMCQDSKSMSADELQIVNERHKQRTYVVSTDPLFPLWRLTCNVLTWKSLFGSYISRHFLNI
ncbi:hypothetical protein YC2023_050293 [Brassica napus]